MEDHVAKLTRISQHLGSVPLVALGSSSGRLRSAFAMSADLRSADIRGVGAMPFSRDPRPARQAMAVGESAMSNA